MTDEPLVPLSEMSAAMDEIYLLRSLLAYEAAVREADLELATYPKSRRRVAQEAIARMRSASRGDRGNASLTAEVGWRSLEEARNLAGMGQCLNRPGWLSQRGLPVTPARQLDPRAS